MYVSNCCQDPGTIQSRLGKYCMTCAKPCTYIDNTPPEEYDDDDDHDDYCTNCGGSGQGAYEGARCHVCKGRGSH